MKTALVLFAGGGGSTRGLEEAGFVTVSIDNEEHCVATLSANGYTYGRMDLSGRQEALLHYYEEASPDLLWMSPPCQRFSQAGNGTGVDGFPWGMEVVRRLRPRWVIVENVKQAPWMKWLGQLEDEGYTCAYWMLNARDYGVPQSRVRGFLLASRDAEPPPVSVLDPYRKPLVSMGDALPWLRGITGGTRPARLGGRVVYPEGIGGDRPEMLDRPAPTITCQEVKGTRASASSGWVYHGGPDRASDAAFSAARVRRLSVEDCAILQGFPPEHRFLGTITQRYRMVGNAVPPVMARILGLVISSVGKEP